MTRRAFGRLNAADKRDALHKIAPPRRLPSAKKMWREGWSGDQGGTSECVGYAWAHWLTNYPISQYLPPKGIYSLAQEVDEWDGIEYEGTSVRAGAKVLHHLEFIKEYQWASDVSALAFSLLHTGPAVLGVDWKEGMMKPDSRGFIRVSGKSRGGHAILCNGVDTEAKVFRLKNSWGESWGMRGSCWVSFADMESLLNQDGEACVATESRAIPERV